MPHRWDGASGEHPVPPARLFVSLSPRELQILELIRDDGSNADVSRELGITEQTVKNHMSSIFEKLGVQSRTAAVIHAIRCGFISLQPEDAPHPDGPTVMEAVKAARQHMDRELDEIVAAVARMRRPD